MEPKHIHIKDYSYPLPDERIAKFPLAERDASKLLLYRQGNISEDVFADIPDYLPEGALMIFNNTRVVRARLHFRKDRPAEANGTGDTVAPMPEPHGALIEIFILEPATPAEYQENFLCRGCCSWYCLVGNLKKWEGRHAAPQHHHRC